MITLVITNRNRDLQIVKNCFDSLYSQSDHDFQWCVVDYGSDPEYLVKFTDLVAEYPQIKLILCPVSKQLWNKSRAINIVLQQTETLCFFVGDIDMMYDVDFISTVKSLYSENQATYFQVGFLDQKESTFSKPFTDYKIAFKSTTDATGMTLYPTQALKNINGYDEFYHGWGAEDTDVHQRLANADYQIRYYDKSILMLHQWHPKAYRKTTGNTLFHSELERINSEYLSFSALAKIQKANNNGEWGKSPVVSDYQSLSGNPDLLLDVDSQSTTFFGIISQFPNFFGIILELKIKSPPANKIFKQNLKKIAGKKHINYLDLEIANNFLLEEIVRHYRNLPYEYNFDRTNQIIHLKIKF